MVWISDDEMQRELAASRSYTLVLLCKTRPEAGPDVAGIVHEHARRNFALRADGVLPIVCPITDDGDWAGMGLFDAAPDEVDRIMRDDPGVMAGVFTYELHPVRGFPGDRLPGGSGADEVPPSASPMFFSIHTLDGDPQGLLAAKHEHMDPVVARLAPAHGAVASITVAGDAGLTTYNVWRSQAGAESFSQEPEAQQAQRASGLPAPSSFIGHLDAEVTLYADGGR